MRVFCRLKPHPSPALLCLADGTSVKTEVDGKDQIFSFDRVFGASATQQQVFDEVSELVQSALDGYQVQIPPMQTMSVWLFLQFSGSRNRKSIQLLSGLDWGAGRWGALFSYKSGHPKDSRLRIPKMCPCRTVTHIAGILLTNICCTSVTKNRLPASRCACSAMGRQGQGKRTPCRVARPKNRRESFPAL